MNSLHPRRSWLLAATIVFAPILSADCQTSFTANRSEVRRLLTVDSVIAFAWRENPRVGAAIEAQRAAEGSRRTAGRWSNPTFTYQAENTGFPGQGSPQGLDRETSAFAMIPLEPAYQLRSRIARSDAMIRAAGADVRFARRDVTLRAVSAFYSTALGQIEVATLDDTRAWLDSLVRYTGARVREGAAAEVDLIRLEVERDRAETDLALARVNLSRSRSVLASLIGDNEFEIALPATGAPEVLRFSPQDLQLALATARKTRPEIASADARLDAASSGVAVERSSLVREMGLMTGAKSTAGTRSMMTGISLSLPLFDQNRGEVQRAEAERRIALLDRQLAEREVIADVTATFAAVQTLSAQIARMQDGLIRRAEEARRVSEGAYREGAIPLTQVLDAARTLSDARRLYYRALFSRDQAVIELNSSLEIFDANPAHLINRSIR